MPEEIYQLKVTLANSKPPIWRRLQVPSGYRLSHLHSVIQAVMEWQDSHLHEFRIENQRFGVPFEDDSDVADEAKVRLHQVMSHVGAKAIYTYDFGDSWEHLIAVEKILPGAPGLRYPVCTGGKRRGPPEDCGAIYGYYRLLDVIHDPDDEEHEEMLEWAGGPINPEDFSLADMNGRLASFCKTLR